MAAGAEQQSCYARPQPGPANAGPRPGQDAELPAGKSGRRTSRLRAADRGLPVVADRGLPAAVAEAVADGTKKTIIFISFLFLPGVSRCLLLPAKSFKSVAISNMKPALYYCYDAYCGWCYGFSPVIRRVFEEYQDSIELRSALGGHDPPGYAPADRVHGRLYPKGL